MNNLKTFENIVNDGNEPTNWNHKNLLTFKDHTDTMKPEENVKPLSKKIKRLKKSKDIAIQVI